MNYVVFTNVGTSIIGNFQRPLDDSAKAEFFNQLNKLKDSVDPSDMEKTGHHMPGKELFDRLCEFARKRGPEASAEYKSTEKIIEDFDGALPERLYLFATDTVDGVLSAQVVKEILADIHPEISLVEVERVAGLQVDDGARFARQGLPTYISKLYEYLRSCPPHAYRRVFNPTGGFKSVVPYMTIVAMLEGCETRYVYERSDDLLELRSLPINFDEELLRVALPVLEKGDAGAEFTAEELQQELELDEPLYRSPHAALWDDLDGEFILSGLGSIVVERYRSHKDEIWISEEARADLEAMGGDRRRAIMPGIRKLQRNDTRKMATREKFRRDETDTDCIGKNNTDWRVHYVEDTQEGRPLVKIVRVFHKPWNGDERDRILKSSGIFSDDVGGWEPFDFDEYS